MASTSFDLSAAYAPRHSRLRHRAEPYLYVLPAALFVAVFLLYPMVLTLWRSFTRFDGITAPVFIGLENFRELFIDAHFLISLRNTLIWTVAAVALPVTLGLVFALAFNRLRGSGFFKVMIYLPA